MDKRRRRFNINMTQAAAGVVLILLGCLQFRIINDNKGFLVTFIGFLLVVGYIRFLEQKAGVTNKVLWIKAIVSILLFAIVGYLFFV